MVWLNLHCKYIKSYNHCTAGLWFLQISPAVQRSVKQTFETFQMLIWIMPIFPRLKRCASQEMVLCLLRFCKWQRLNAKNAVKEHTVCRVKIEDLATITTIYFFSAKALYKPGFLYSRVLLTERATVCIWYTVKSCILQWKYWQCIYVSMYDQHWYNFYEKECQLNCTTCLKIWNYGYQTSSSSNLLQHTAILGWDSPVHTDWHVNQFVSLLTIGLK